MKELRPSSQGGLAKVVMSSRWAFMKNHARSQIIFILFGFLCFPCMGVSAEDTLPPRASKALESAHDNIAEAQEAYEEAIQEAREELQEELTKIRKKAISDLKKRLVDAAVSPSRPVSIKGFSSSISRTRRPSTFSPPSEPSMRFLKILNPCSKLISLVKPT